ncbi:uncharacterized protein GGS22DRAFT_15564 [Annulohypoxylon maeteangense]|uniref:uncharacterized protein n=1 Tax=Annulohypoxylon maeteangense TaxID=1927788 RepID=UPI002007D9D0|nr:uncharacterized protein GGS22DRAFT_15564 [Annulohypoxylon maeteangense]KAI0890582.1 hypothetical protein GGS22DRAFT_15564 [Annulohypoxylon maeteangense]
MDQPSTPPYARLPKDPEPLPGTWDRPLLGISNTRSSHPELGKPCDKPRLYIYDLVAIVVTLGCFSTSICIVTPSLDWGWALGFKYQLIIIGLLLSVENLCLQRVLRMTFLIIEARWGRSNLQNYDAILRNTVLGDRMGNGWRAGILFFICLPTGLSVAYKLFIGGESTARIFPDIDGRQYGFMPPSEVNIALAVNFLNPPYLFINSTSDFFHKSISDDEFPHTSIAEGKATPYGYNLLLLSNESAAALDLPEPSYVNAIQSRLGDTDSWTVSASVYGLVSRRNNSIESLRMDDGFWEDLLKSTNKSFNGLSSFGMFVDHTSFGMIPFLPHQHEEASCFLGAYYPSATYWDAYYNTATDPDILAFRNHAYQFTTRRQLCHAKWIITKSSMTLLEGDCPQDEEPVNSSMFSAKYAEIFAPFVLDSLPVLVHSLGSFNRSYENRVESLWKIPSYALAVADSYWARGTFLLYNGNPDSIRISSLSRDFVYAPMNESISSTVSTIRPDPLLYLVLAVQPLIIILLLIFNTKFYLTPFSDGFNLVSILAGVNPHSLQLLSGAGFSGELKQQVTMSIFENESYIRYTLHQSKEKIALPVLSKGRVYH